MPDFVSDGVITNAEISPAVLEANIWLKKTYPNHPLRFSSDVTAQQSAGFTAVVGVDRIIALQVAKYIANGGKITGILQGQNAKPATVALALDMLKDDAYAEASIHPSITMGNLNTVWGGILCNLIEGGATEAAPTSSGTTAEQRAKISTYDFIEKTWPGIIKKLLN